MQFRRLTRWTSALMCVAGLTPRATAADSTSANPALRVYSVNKRVSAYGTNEDLSTPEAAYVAFNRAYAAEGAEGARRLTVRRLSEQMAPVPPKPAAAKLAEELLGSEIIEVRISQDRDAAVIARVPNARKTLIDLRLFEWEGERWLNAGQDIWDSVEAARTKFAGICARREAERRLSSRPAIANPEEHLRPFVEFLRREAQEPHDFLLQNLARHRLVILGEVHNRQRYWAFNTALVRRPEFARRAGVIYLEFPQSDQALMDRFLAAPEYDPEPVIEMLRNMFELGWPDRPTLEFCQAVRELNQSLPSDQRVRVVLVDMARPWKEIQKRQDWRKYDVDRDELMARNIVQDLRKHETGMRNAMFIVGYMHAPKALDSAGAPIKSTGWHLVRALGNTNVFSIFPHSPVIANRGTVGGRIGMGRFEVAFAALTNRPMAFPLDHGPFAEQPFDASLDHPTTDLFPRGYDAYLYLGPLEDEIFSPLIPGFYTDAYALEVDRRCKLMFGRGAVETYRLDQLSGENLAKMRSAWWGQPRREWSAKRLGPLNAWQLGSDWEKELLAAKRKDWPAETNLVRQAAARLFEAIRQADYAKPGDWESFPAPDVEYWVHSDAPAWMNWICRHFRTNPIVNLDLGAIAQGADGWPSIPYLLTLKDTTKLEGMLPLKWNARAQQWYGVEGLDWHLRSRP